MKTSSDYFDWLCSKVWDGTPDGGFRPLMAQLHSRNFTWLILRDRNRAYDGLSMRCRFFGSDPVSLSNCSVLEMLIALAERIDRDVMTNGEEDRTKTWFWEMLHNLADLDMYYPVNDPDMPYTVDCALDRFLSRTYGEDGLGGLFPLRNPSEDQRNVEIWYQMMAYFLENHVKIG